MMKKIILLFLSVILCLCATYACAEEAGREVWSLNEYIDEFNRKTGGLSFGAVYDSWRQDGTSEDAPADAAPMAEGVWQVVEYIDEFDLPTGSFYIATTEPATGTYKNAFTTDGVLTAQLYVYRSEEDQEEEVAIHLFRDGKYLTENDEPMAVYYDSVVMDADGKKEDFVGCFYARGSELRIGSSQAKPVIAALRGGGTVRFSLTRRDAKVIRYIFTFEDVSGFDSVYTGWSQK